MKRKKHSFTGSRPIFTGSPSKVIGGFNLDRSNQNFADGDIIPGGVLAIANEETRLVQVIKTAKVAEVDSEDAKLVTLEVDEFYAPFFAVGDMILKAGTAATAIASVPTIKKIEEKGNIYKITLSAAITGLTKGDVLEEVISDGDATTPKSKSRGLANSVTVADNEVKEFETSIDVSADTLQYALYERRVLPIPASQKDDTGAFLKANPHVKFTKSH
ncbi:hypothetical protein D1647_02290 [Alistipes sp. Z76]|nr:hypothetical protein [Alistipes sp. Z76]NCE67041.1 hypothetical protein [Muribaculaceae bacterium M3]